MAPVWRGTNCLQSALVFSPPRIASNCALGASDCAFLSSRPLAATSCSFTSNSSWSFVNFGPEVTERGEPRRNG